VFSRIIEKGSFTLDSGVKSSYNYDYSAVSDTMNPAYCQLLKYKLDQWQNQHGMFDIVVGIETEGIRIAYQLAEMMELPFTVIPHKRTDFEQLVKPSWGADPHFLIVDDIVTTGHSMIRAIEFLDIEEKEETVTFGCMIKRNPSNLDYSAVKGDRSKEEMHIKDRRFDAIDKRLVSLFNEPE
jgi:orotate phosphoribosyltransferase